MWISLPANQDIGSHAHNLVSDVITPFCDVLGASYLRGLHGSDGNYSPNSALVNTYCGAMEKEKGFSSGQFPAD
jgi:hypothetical protein